MKTLKSILSFSLVLGFSVAKAQECKEYHTHENEIVQLDERDSPVHLQNIMYIGDNNKNVGLNYDNKGNATIFRSGKIVNQGQTLGFAEYTRGYALEVTDERIVANLSSMTAVTKNGTLFYPAKVSSLEKKGGAEPSTNKSVGILKDGKTRHVELPFSRENHPFVSGFDIVKSSSGEEKVSVIIDGIVGPAEFGFLRWLVKENGEVESAVIQLPPGISEIVSQNTDTIYYTAADDPFLKKEPSERQTNLFRYNISKQETTKIDSFREGAVSSLSVLPNGNIALQGNVDDVYGRPGKDSVVFVYEDGKKVGAVHGKEFKIGKDYMLVKDPIGMVRLSDFKGQTRTEIYVSDNEIVGFTSDGFVLKNGVKLQLYNFDGFLKAESQGVARWNPVADGTRLVLRKPSQARELHPGHQVVRTENVPYYTPCKSSDSLSPAPPPSASGIQ